MIFQEYERMKSGRYTDENDIFEKMLTRIQQVEFFRNRRVWIDSFTGFTNRELELISIMLRQCSQVTITLCTDLEGEPAFECTDRTFQLLQELAKQNHVPCNVTNLSADPQSNRYKYQNASIFFLEQNLPKVRVTQQQATAKIVLAECSGPYEEVMRCAERIRALHDNQKIGYRHIAVALRNVEVYDVMIKALFKKYGIPFYIDDKKTLDNNPLIKTILSILSIISEDWQVKDVLECIKSGILNFGGDADQIENYILLKGLRGRRQWKRE